MYRSECICLIFGLVVISLYTLFFAIEVTIFGKKKRKKKKRHLSLHKCLWWWRTLNKFNNANFIPFPLLESTILLLLPVKRLRVCARTTCNSPWLEWPFACGLSAMPTFMESDRSCTQKNGLSPVASLDNARIERCTSRRSNLKFQTYYGLLSVSLPYISL